MRRCVSIFFKALSFGGNVLGTQCWCILKSKKDASDAGENGITKSACFLRPDGGGNSRKRIPHWIASGFDDSHDSTYRHRRSGRSSVERRRVYFETSFGADGSSCTGALWKPQVIVSGIA